MRIFVTGATGFIGSHFVNQATTAGFEIIALRRHAKSKPPITLIQEPLWLTKELADVDSNDLECCKAVVHLAAAGVTPQKATWDELIRINIHASQNLFEIANRAGISRWVVAGTFAEYGNVGEKYEYIPTDAPLAPTYPYSASKAAFYSIVSAMAIQYGATLAYFRVFSAYGEGQHENNFWPALRQAALSGKDFQTTLGEQTRDFISVETVAETLLNSVTRTDIESGKPWVKNLATGTPVTISEFGKYWWKVFKAKGQYLEGTLPYRPNEVMRYVPLVDHNIFKNFD